MYEDVMVAKIVSPKLVEVTCPESACKGCKGASFCNTKGQCFEALNTKRLHLEEGMHVRILLSPSKTIMSSLITLIFPLLLFPVGYFIASRLGLKEGGSVLVGLGFIAIGFTLAWLYFKKRKTEYTPTVDTILD